MSVVLENSDKAGKRYWDTTERNRNVDLKAFDPAQSGVRNFGRRMWHGAFESVAPLAGGKGKRLLELGCGGSAFLPYFARQFGVEVAGIDYSESGCDLARQICEVHGVSANVICADFFLPAPRIERTFDIVVSFGVVEHFTQTSQTLRRFGEFLRPGGLLLTTIPNMHGLVGLTQKALARDVFDKHVALDCDAFRKAHEDAGFTILDCRYFMFVNFGVVNAGPNPTRPKRLAMAALKAVTAGAWIIESAVAPMPANRLSSPYLMCIAQKPGA